MASSTSGTKLSANKRKRGELQLLSDITNIFVSFMKIAAKHFFFYCYVFYEYFNSPISSGNRCSTVHENIRSE